MSDRVRTTSVQRTYRYLRIAISGTVVVIFVAVAVTIPVVGVLPSLSHYYYSPARTIFVGAVITVSVCFFALSGRGPERVLLDAAAMLAPLIAIVPTVISPRSVPGVDVSCVGSCLPEAFDADVDSGVATYLIVGVLIVMLTVALIVTGQVDAGGAALSISIASAVLLIVGITWWLWQPVFLQWGHFLTAIAFFGCIAAVAVVTAFWPTDRRKPPRWLQVAYVVLAVALALDVLGLPVYGSERLGDVYGVFVGEVGALLLFVAFWALQSIQYWNADDEAAAP